MSSVGIPIKLLYEAEGMKVTVEVSVRRLTNRIEYRAMLAHTSFAKYIHISYVHLVSHGFRRLSQNLPLCKS